MSNSSEITLIKPDLQRELKIGETITDGTGNTYVVKAVMSGVWHHILLDTRRNTYNLECIGSKERRLLGRTLKNVCSTVLASAGVQ